jgi:hypothetical protein
MIPVVNDSCCLSTTQIVIPAQAGIFGIHEAEDPGLRRDDDKEGFLAAH